jgi:hypothetical protein
MLTSLDGGWVPAAGGIQCPHDRDLFVEAVLLTMVPDKASRMRRPGGPAISPDGGLHVVLRAFRDPGSVAGDQPIPIVRSAVWTPSEGWMEVVNDWTDLRGLGGPTGWTDLRDLGGPDLGAALYALVLNGLPSPGVAEWLSGILADPARIVLSLEVMES